MKAQILTLAVAILGMNCGDGTTPKTGACPDGFSSKNSKCLYDGPTATVFGEVRDFRTDDFIDGGFVQLVDGTTAQAIDIYTETSGDGKYTLSGVPADRTIGLLVRAEDALDTYRQNVHLKGGNWKYLPLGSMSDLTFKLLAPFVGADPKAGTSLVIGTVFKAEEKPYTAGQAEVFVDSHETHYFGRDGKPVKKDERDFLNPENGRFLLFNVSPTTASVDVRVANVSVTAVTIPIVGDSFTVVNLDDVPSPSASADQSAPARVDLSAQ